MSCFWEPHTSVFWYGNLLEFSFVGSMIYARNTEICVLARKDNLLYRKCWKRRFLTVYSPALIWHIVARLGTEHSPAARLILIRLALKYPSATPSFLPDVLSRLHEGLWSLRLCHGSFALATSRPIQRARPRTTAYVAVRRAGHATAAPRFPPLPL